MATYADREREVGHKLVRRWLFWAELLFGLAILAVIVFEWSARRAWRQALQAAMDDPYPATIEELEARRRQWPADQNAATVLLAIWDRLAEEGKALLGDAEGLLSLIDHAESSALGRLPMPDLACQLEDYVQERAELLAEIDRYTDFPGAALPPLADGVDPFEFFIPDLSPLRYSARLKALQMAHKAVEENTGHLVDDMAILMRHGEMVADHPTLISALVSISCDSLAVGTLEQIHALSVPTPDQLRALIAMLDDRRPGKTLDSGMMSERVYFLTLVEYLRSGNTIMGTPPVASIPVLGGFLHREVAFGLRLENRRAAAGEDIEKRLRLEEEMNESVESHLEHALFGGLLFSFNKRACELALRQEAEIRTARVGLALEWYRQEQGDFPESLDALVPQYLEAVPPDPFAAGPVRYCLTPELALVYSVGLNGVDDGGELGHLCDKMACDLGFRVLRPERRRLPPLPEAEQREAAGN